MWKEHPLRRFKGKTCVIRARAFRNRKPEPLGEHIIRFAVADRDTKQSIFQLQTGNGITQDAHGNYEIQVPANQMSTGNLPDNEYWYEVEILVGGSSTDRHPLLYGPLYLMNSPFS